MTDDEAMQWLSDDERARFTADAASVLRALAAMRKASFDAYMTCECQACCFCKASGDHEPDCPIAVMPRPRQVQRKPCHCTDTSLEESVRRNHGGHTRNDAGEWLCVHCGGFLPCEFVYLDDVEHPATVEHCGYFTCAEHLRIAVDNVGSRQS